MSPLIFNTAKCSMMRSLTFSNRSGPCPARLGVVQVEIVLGDVVPRKVQEGFEVVRLHTVFACLRIHALKLPDFFVEGLSGMFRPVFACGFRALSKSPPSTDWTPVPPEWFHLWWEKFPLLLVRSVLTFRWISCLRDSICFSLWSNSSTFCAHSS